MNTQSSESTPYSNRKPPASKLYRPRNGSIPDPDAEVKKIEDLIGCSVKGPLDLTPLALNSMLPTRPGFATRGTPTVLFANFVDLQVPSDLRLYIYDIGIEPSLTGRQKYRVIQLWLESRPMQQLAHHIVTDFKSIILSKQRLRNNELSFPVIYRDDREDNPSQDAVTYTVRLKHAQDVAQKDLLNYVASTNLSDVYRDKMVVIQALNILLKHHTKAQGDLGRVRLDGAGVTYSMDTTHQHNLGLSLKLIRGFFSSVRAVTGRTLVNVQVKHGVFYVDGPLQNLIKAYLPQVKNRLTPLQLNYLGAFLKLLKVKKTNLPKRKNRAGLEIPVVRTISDLATKKDGEGMAHKPIVDFYGAGAKEVKFWLGEGSLGRYVTVYSYFLESYHIELQHFNMPVVNVGDHRNPIYLPPEICDVLPGQLARQKLSPEQTAEMIKHAVLSPKDSADSIVQEGLRTTGLTKSTNPTLTEFGVSVGSELITVSGRVLQAPRVFYRGEKPAKIVSGGWNMSNSSFTHGSKIQSWSYISIIIPADPAGQQPPAAFWRPRMDRFRKAMQAAGIDAPIPLNGQTVELDDAFDRKLDQCIHRAAQFLKLLIVILPNENAQLYNQVKKLADIKHGIHTVCVIGSKFDRDKGSDQYFANVSLKVNLKLGGCNQHVDPSRLGFVKEGKTIIVGIDVTHPSPLSSIRAPSIAGMVASCDGLLGQWPAVLHVQRSRQEMVSGLREMIKSRLEIWRSKNGKYPENILVYRDGVSEGQYEMVVEEEFPAIEAGCRDLYRPAGKGQGQARPRFTIIICGKRHHSRFYATKASEIERSGNPRAGTVVDRGVTEARTWEFFLQAHNALQGTARSAHYVVVHDEIFRRLPLPPNLTAADLLEDLTLSLSYSYGPATKAVSIATPVYYADILCERARCYLSEMFNEALINSAAPLVITVKNLDIQAHPKLVNSMFYL